jgi:formylglycine-generating enzyme required for sulfatase activity
MGSPTDEPDRRGSDETQHQVTLTQGFFMAKYQVTQEQYVAVVGSNPSNFTGSPDAGETQGKRPVENVTWYDAIEFCNKLSELEVVTQR